MKRIPIRLKLDNVSQICRLEKNASRGSSVKIIITVKHFTQEYKYEAWLELYQCFCDCKIDCLKQGFLTRGT